MITLTTMAARIGKRIHPATSFEQVSTAYRETIERLGLGASQAPRCEIVDCHGTVIAHCAYNGRVFAGARYEPGATVLYDPYA